MNIEKKTEKLFVIVAAVAIVSYTLTWQVTRNETKRNE